MLLSPPITVTSADGVNSVLLTLPVSSSSKGMGLALSLGCSHVFSASVCLLGVKTLLVLAICFGAEVQHWSKSPNYHHAPHSGWEIHTVLKKQSTRTRNTRVPFIHSGQAEQSIQYLACCSVFFLYLIKLTSNFTREKNSLEFSFLLLF